MARFILIAILLLSIIITSSDLVKGTNNETGIGASFPISSILTGLPESPASFSLMPPSPELEKLLKEGKVKLPDYIFNQQSRLIRGVDVPEKPVDFRKLPRSTRKLPSPSIIMSGLSPGQKQAAASSASGASGYAGQFRLLAILVDFYDKPSQVDPRFFDNLVFASNGSSSVWKFYWENSYAQFDIITVNLPSALGWNRPPGKSYYPYVAGVWDGTKYVNCTVGLGAYPNNTQKLTEDLVDLIDPLVNFSNYDNDGNGNVEGIIIVHPGSGYELSRNTCDIWSHKWGITPRKKDGVFISSYSVQPEYWNSPGDMTIGVYAHEFGHLLGLPDLYDTDGSSRGIGKWSLMASGSWNGALGSSPSHLDAWSKQRLGWAAPNPISSGTIIAQLPQIETNSAGMYKLYGNGTPTTEYFLLENRQKVGYDASLPGAGMLIWHVDDTRTSNTREWYPGYTSNGHFWVALEQADGLWQLDKNLNYGDANDPYPGGTNNRVFDAFSTPSSDNYNFNHTGISVSNISNSSSLMTANITIGGSASGANGSLSVTSNPTASNVYLNGGLRGVTPITISNLLPGNYQLSVWKADYYSENRTVSIMAGFLSTIISVLTGLPGTIRVNSTPINASIYLDGAFKGYTYLVISNVSATNHLVVLSKANYSNLTISFAVPANGTVDVGDALIPLNATLMVNSTPSSASVYLDSIFRGFTFLTISQILPGSHMLYLTKANYSSYNQSLVLSANQTQVVNAVLTPLAGSMQISSTPTNAKVFLDGILKGNSPLTISNVAAGTRQLLLTLANYADYSLNVVVPANGSLQLSITMQPLPGAISVGSNPSSANTFLDGVFEGQTPIQIANVPAGLHQVLLQKADYADYSQSVNVPANGTAVLSATLNPLTSAISVTSNPSAANVFMGGIAKGLTPLAISNVAYGIHQILVNKSGYQDYTTSINAVSNTTYTIYANLSPIAPTKGSIFANSTPIGANVSVDYIFQGISPLTISNLDPITHPVQFRMAGFENFDVFVDVQAGNTTNVNAILIPLPPEPSPQPKTGNITGITNPVGADMRVDGAFAGITPFTATGLSTGLHDVLFMLEGYENYSAKVDVMSDQTSTLSATLMPLASCTDTDGGIDNATAGSVYGYKNGTFYNNSDNCIGNILAEYYCQNSSYASKAILCEDECQNGACILVAPPAGVPPIIDEESINASASYYSASISWLTDIRSDSVVHYGYFNVTTLINETDNSTYLNVSTNLNFSNSSSAAVKSHVVSIFGLSPQKLYAFYVGSCNGANCTSSEIHNFTTPALPTPQPPQQPGSPGGGSYNGPGSPPRPKPSASPSPSPTPLINASLEFIEIKGEIEKLLPEIRQNKAQSDEVKRLLEEARLLEVSGNRKESVQLLYNARAKLLTAIATSRTQKANFSWQLALIAFALFLSLVWFRYDSLRKGESRDSNQK